jgi:hypothetical protein
MRGLSSANIVRESEKRGLRELKALNRQLFCFSDLIVTRKFTESFRKTVSQITLSSDYTVTFKSSVIRVIREIKSASSVYRKIAAVHASFYTTCRQVIYSSMTQ